MPRNRTPSFILELPLRTSPADERACAIMLDAARNIGNAVLGEGPRRLDLMRESKAYQAARRNIWRDGCVRLAGLVIAAILDPANAWQSETLKSPTKYCRVIRRQIRGRCRWHVELVQEG
jgi:hypothetical protein